MNALGTFGLDRKTRAPRPARGLIARPRLEGLHHQVCSRPLTLVTAPPGYGKTTLGLAWAQALAAEGARVGWLRLDAQDAEAERFLGALAVALGRACRGDAANGLSWVAGDLSVPEARRIEWLLEQPAACADDVVLFVDDAHEVQAPLALEALQTLLHHAPDNLHLVLLGRRQPPLALGRLRAHDAVLELPAAALCFDASETDLLLRRLRPDGGNPGDVAQLQAATGGWVAALRAAVLAHHLHEASAPAASHRPPQLQPPMRALRPVEGLFSELLDALDPQTLHLVECATVTARTDALLARHLSGLSDAGERLERLEQQQLFVGRDDDGGWEFHRLFRDHVQRRVQTRDPALAASRHAAAAHWYAGRGAWGDAIEHALAGQATAQALAWIEQQAMSLVGTGDLLTLLAWERQLRAHLVQSPRRLRLAFAWGLSLAMACDRALALLDGVEAEIQAEAGGGRGDSPAAQALQEECLALRAVIVTTTGDYELGAELAARVRDDPRPAPWVANAVRNLLAASHLHTGRWRHLYGAAPVVGTAQAGSRPGDPMSIDYRLSILGLAEYRQGHLDEAASLLEQAMAVGASQAAAPVLQALPAPTLALVRYEQGRLAEAGRLNNAHFEINRRVAPIEGLYGAYLVAARLARLDGQPIRARQLLDEGESIGAARGWRRVVVALRLERLRHCLLDGRVAESVACVDSIASVARPGTTLPALEARDFAHAAATARGWLELADGSPRRAVELLAAEHARAGSNGMLLAELTLGTSLALAQMAAGMADQALAQLAASSRKAMAAGALRSQLDQPVLLLPLLQAATGTDGPRDAALDAHLQRMLAACGEGGSRRGAATAIDSLSPRELHILRLMAEGQSNKTIARGLGIAPETVKTHVSKIFGKLGASNRAQAAAMIANP